MFRKAVHFFFHLLLILLVFNYRFLTWKEYVFLLLVGLVVAISYTRTGAALTPVGRWGLAPVHYLLLITLFYLASFPVAKDHAITSGRWWLLSIGGWISLCIIALGILTLLWWLAERDRPAEHADERNVLGEFTLAVLLTIIVIGGISIGVDRLIVPSGAMARHLDLSFMIVAINGVLLLLAASNIFLGRLAGEQPGGLFGLFVVRDYRPHFLVLLALLCGYGAFGAGRLLMIEWRAGEAYGRKDFTEAEKGLREVLARNTTLRLAVIERRSLERLGEILLSQQKYEPAAGIYRQMLAGNPFDTVALLKMTGVEAARGNFKAAATHLAAIKDRKVEPSALQRLDAILTPFPGFVEGQYMIGRWYLAAGSLAKAEAKFNAVLGFDAHHIPALGLLADTKERAGAADEARRIRARLWVRIEEKEWQGRNGGDLFTYGECSVERSLSPGTWELRFDASATPAKEIWPRLLVRVDEIKVGELSVNSRQSMPYTAVFRIEDPGPHKVALLFENDDSVVDGTGKIVEDRNAYIHGAVIRWIDH